MSAPPFTVRALFEYTSEHEDDLTFPIGQIITVTEEEDAEWYFGYYIDESGTRKEGIFPRNFVERYEPPAPPRPSRPSRQRREPEPAPPTETWAPIPVEDSKLQQSSESERVTAADISPKSNPIAAPQAVQKEASPPAVRAVPSQPAVTSQSEERVESAPKTSSKPPPPAVTEKPTGSSFKDRIAAFNKPAAAPIAPFNPNQPPSANAFIRKPFVAPPPSKNAYVPPPPPPVQPQKIYRREEDPEIQERTAQDQAMAERYIMTKEEQDTDEDQPKPTTLKERIALLQKQQLEQAARRTEAAQKKGKSKKSAKKPTEPEGQEGPAHKDQEPRLERTETSETVTSPVEVEQHQGDDKHASPAIPSPQQPPRELTSDTNDADHSGAGDTEEADESSTSKEDISAGLPEGRPSISGKDKLESDQHVESKEREGGDTDEEEEEEDIDPEIKRRMELRERMAKMSGGMGMMGMFGPPPGIPGMVPPGFKMKSKPSEEPERKRSNEQQAVPVMHAPPVPLMGLPAHSKDRVTASQEVDADKTAHPSPSPDAPQKQPPLEPSGEAEEAQYGTDRVPMPPPPSHEGPREPLSPSISRPVPPPPQIGDNRPSSSSITASQNAPIRSQEANASLALSDESDGDSSGVSPDAFKGDRFTNSQENEEPHQQQSLTSDAGSPTIPSTIVDEKRYSRSPPPPPPAVPPTVPPAQSRPPPPPPPVPVTRASTSDSRVSVSSPQQLPKNESEEEVTEYEGDYDTDIAPTAKHKDSLRAHQREDSSMDEGTITDDFSTHSPRSPRSPQGRPPIPSTTAPRAVPPPPPSQPPKPPRQSFEIPRVPPPPIPPPKDPYENVVGENKEYDPFRYDAGHSGGMSMAFQRAPAEESQNEDLYGVSPPLRSAPVAPPPPPPERAVVPPPPPPHSPPPQASRSAPRQSIDVLRGQGNVRRSMDIPRPSIDHGHIACDVDLGEGTLWWTQPNTPPPVFQNRRDILFEVEESKGQDTLSKNVYVLFMDYSQTIISVQFDPRNPHNAILEQRSEPPPPRLRQDQLENAHMQFGSRISAAVAAKHNTIVGDGTPFALIHSLLTPLSDALLPVGVRAYGALVYANLANASVQQFDEIRAGDIVSFRNARFQGHRGTMHQKYNAEVGKPDHVGVIVDWDGTKKKIRAWEQGRESKKVKMESFKLGDLKSGECRVWRVMPRSWVGWDGAKV